MTKLSNYWGEHFLFCEKMFSFVVVILFLIYVEFLGGMEISRELLNGSRSSLYGAIISAFGSLFGFVITSMSIIATWVDHTKFKLLRQKSAYSHLWDIFISATVWLAVGATIAIAAIIFDQNPAADGTRRESRAIWYALMFSVIVASFRLYRTVWVMEKLVHMIAPPIKEESPATNEWSSGEKD